MVVVAVDNGTVEASIEKPKGDPHPTNKEAERVRSVFDADQVAPVPGRYSCSTDPARHAGGCINHDPRAKFFYPVDAPPEDVLKDLKRLLKVSQIG